MTIGPKYTDLTTVLTETIDDDLAYYDDVIRKLRGTYIAKNADYGSSFDKSIDEFGYISAVVRMSDKMERMKSLIKDKGRVEDESLEDTVMDMANYAIMFAMYIRKGETGDR